MLEVVSGCVGDSSNGGIVTTYAELGRMDGENFYRLVLHSLECKPCFYDRHVASAIHAFQRDSEAKEEEFGLRCVEGCIGKPRMRNGMIIQHKIGPDLSYHGLRISEHLRECRACWELYEMAERYRGPVRGAHYFSGVVGAPSYLPVTAVQYPWDIEYHMELIDHRLREL
ncbi:MAG: hypothetical protein BWY68_00217 [bacterium ADurb.Bin400]|nr:MAG: hypothetical protein BWY68_00217 [bacterium ADurb.Bin400]